MSLTATRDTARVRLVSAIPANSHLQIGFAVAVALGLAAHAGGMTRLLYPLAAMAIALRLMTTSTADYVSFIIWLWVLSPLVRRVADLQAGWQDPSPVLLTPYLVTVLGAVHATMKTLVFPTRPVTLPRGATMFVLAGLGVASGVPIGFASHAPGAMLETLNWMAPIVFGAYLATCIDDAQEVESAIVDTFAKAGIVLGAYGVYQFFRLPLWDENWMRNSGMHSIGLAEALSVRVFSTMHSPGVLAFFIILPMVSWLANPRARGLTTVCLASVTLLLSQVRTAWAAFAVSAILLVLTMKLGTALRVLLLTVLGGLCIAPFLQLPDVSDRVNARIETIRDMPNYDSSSQARADGHKIALDYVFAHPLGAGIGAAPPELDLIGVRDSTMIAGFVQFGILGMSVYLLALCGVIVRLWQYFRTATRPESRGLAAAALGMLATIPLGVPSAAQPGMLVWMMVALAAMHGAPARAAAASTPELTGGAFDRRQAAGFALSEIGRAQ